MLQGAVVINDFNIFWHGMNVKMGGICGVSTYPEARGKYAVAKLIGESLKIMHNKYQVFSLISPFQDDTYGKKWL